MLFDRSWGVNCGFVFFSRGIFVVGPGVKKQGVELQDDNGSCGVGSLDDFVMLTSREKPRWYNTTVGFVFRQCETRRFRLDAVGRFNNILLGVGMKCQNVSRSPSEGMIVKEIGLVETGRRNISVGLTSRTPLIALSGLLLENRGGLDISCSAILVFCCHKAAS